MVEAHDCDGLAHYPRMHREHSYRQGLFAEGEMENADSSAGKLSAVHATSQFHVLTSGAVRAAMLII